MLAAGFVTPLSLLPFARNDIGVRVRMTESLALKAAVQVRHNTDVLPGTEETDQVLTANLVYGF